MMYAAYRPTCVVRLYSLRPCLSGTLKHCRQQSESSSSNTFNSSTLFTTGNDFGLRRSGLGLSSLTSFGASSPSKKSEINFYCGTICCYDNWLKKNIEPLLQRSRLARSLHLFNFPLSQISLTRQILSH